jgi:hypothetical protein
MSRSRIKAPIFNRRVIALSSSFTGKTS